MEDSQLLVIFVPHKYMLLQVEMSKDVSVIKSGKLIGLA